MIIYKDYNIKNINSLKLENIASYMFEPCNFNDIFIIKYLFDLFEVKYHVVGNLSKVIFKDMLIKEPIIYINSKFSELINLDNKVIVSSGMLLSKFISELSLSNKGGFHNLFPIPATIGGAIYMNAGDNKIEIKDFIDNVFILDEYNKIRILTNEECEFSYRKSIFQTKKWIIIYAVIKYKFIDKNIILNEIKQSIQYRIKSQVYAKPNCGSIFKNTLNCRAYELINNIKPFLKKYENVSFSSKHSNFIENYSKDSSQIIALINNAKQLVLEKCGINIEEEVKIL